MKLNETKKGEKQKDEEKNLSGSYSRNPDNRPSDRKCLCGRYRGER